MLLRALPRWPTLLLRALNRDGVMHPRTGEVAQLSGTTGPRYTHTHLRPARKEPEQWWETEVRQKGRGQTARGPVGGALSRGWEGKRGGGAHVDLGELWVDFGICADDLRRIGICQITRHGHGVACGETAQ